MSVVADLNTLNGVACTLRELVGVVDGLPAILQVSFTFKFFGLLTCYRSRIPIAPYIQDFSNLI